jgi:phenylalanyl-tRNA synthetase beta chain
MRLPLSVLKSFIELDLDSIEETLTLLGIEVDSFSGKEPPYRGVVVAKIEHVEKHPAAEKLSLATVTDGKTVFRVVCGAPNCRAGLKTLLAPPGAVVQGQSIEKASIRGVLSEGMLCSALELSLYDDNSGILELDDSFSLGQDAASMWDPTLELSFTPNLGHCISGLGVARELAAAWQKPLLRKSLKARESKEQIEGAVEARVTDFRICPRYTARLLRNVAVGPSPFWLQMQLRAAGHKPINNVVDVANYMLLKYGQPMHAFDFDHIEGKQIRVAPASQPDSIKGLDGNEWTIPEGTLLISDQKKPVAIAGILGGSNSSVRSSTRSVLLEAAAFDPLAIRRASKQIGLRTESSLRFEKGVDPDALLYILDEAAYWVCEFTGAEACRGALDVTQNRPHPRILSLRPERANKILGTTLSENEIESILRRLEMRIAKPRADLWSVTLPFYRNDLQEEVDLIEEIGRIYGYNNIERRNPRFTAPQIPHDPEFTFEWELRRRLSGLGLQEFMHCDLISPALATAVQELSHFKRDLLQTLHSKSEDYSVLRPSLLPGILQSVQRNLDQKTGSLAAFELGRIHFLHEGKPCELPMASIVLTGKEGPYHWDRKPGEVDFYDLKGLLENLFEGFRLPMQVAPSSHVTFHPQRQADLFLGSQAIGCLGQLNPHLLAKFDIKQPVLYAEWSAHAIRQHMPGAPILQPLAQFPSSERDWTCPWPSKKSLSELFETITQAAPPLLERWDLIDVFPTDRGVNATLRFVYRSREKTVSFEDVETAHQAFIARLESKR